MTQVSIIIPVYNAENTLGRAIDSILEQGISDYEIILIDDGSIDKSDTIAFKYTTKYSFIKYYKKENGGVSSARNMGIEKAVGEYITFVDSDDELEQGYYQVMLKAAMSGKYDILISGVKYIRGVVECPSKIYDEEANRNIFAQKFFEYHNSNLNAVWNKWFKKEIVKRIRFEIGRISAEDYLFCLEAFSFSNLIKFIPVCGYRFYQNDFSATHLLYQRYDQIHELDKSLDYRRVTSNWYKRIGVSSRQIEEHYEQTDPIWFYHMVRNILKPGTPYKTKEQKLRQIRRIMDAVEPQNSVKNGKIKGKLSLIVKSIYAFNSPRLAYYIISKC